MTAKTNKGNPSAKRKLIPATGMLLASAIALTSATYAWFTMSREVEVSNISMSATVPEDIQISLGQIGTSNSTASTKESDASLANGKGYLVANNDVVAAPTNDWDWANIADVSEYYQFGRLIPASSTNGTNIYFTPDADGVGKTVKSDAAFYAAANGGVPVTEAVATHGVGAGTKSLMATAHVVTAKNNGYVTDTWKDGNANNATGNYTTSSNWNNTNDDGYYVDIPVWLRTSSVNGANVSVKAYVKPRNASITNAAEGEALYRALRVAILEVGDNQGTTTYTNKTNLVPIADGCEKTANGATVGSLRADPFALSGTSGSDTINYNILNWYHRASGVGADKDAVATIASGTTPTYDVASTYTANATVASLAAPAQTNGVKSSSYGDPTKLIVRVWLEGEDPDCWNDTAGQDWSINLKFNNETTASGGGADSDISGVNQGEAPNPQP